MRVGDILYFSPNYKFSVLNWDDKKILIDAFKDRVKGFYIKPAEKLNDDKNGFAAGVLCVTTIDFLARITIGADNVGERIERWLRKCITEFNQKDPDNRSRTLARRFYEEFRNGLVHEGRIKNCGQFSDNYSELIHMEDKIMVINPVLLLEETKTSFETYMDNVENDTSLFHQFRCALIIYFGDDVEWAKRK
jgi:hypothetical protein